MYVQPERGNRLGGTQLRGHRSLIDCTQADDGNRESVDPTPGPGGAGPRLYVDLMSRALEDLTNRKSCPIHPSTGHRIVNRPPMDPRMR